MDAKSQRRFIYQVLDKSPEKPDIVLLLSRFKKELAARGLSLLGITTDASSLYPEAIQELFPGVTHQLCRFHAIKELNKSVLGAAAGVRKEFKERIPKRPRGRPTKESRQASEEISRLEAQHKELFDNRYLYVQRELEKSERDTLERISEPFPELRQLRSVSEAIHQLYDGPNGMPEAVKKLEELRARVKENEKLSASMKRLFSPNLEKSLAFLDVKGFPGTSNAVERGNRRYRKMQKSVYRVRTLTHIRQRIALDMLRERGLLVRAKAVKLQHAWRNGCG